MSNAKYDPNLVKAMWGPIILIGFESGAFITATMNAVERYTRKAAFNRSIHTQVTDNGGSVTMRFQADSPSILPLQTALKTDLAPGGNVVLPLIVKDLNGLDTIISPLARLISIPVLEHNDGDQAAREFVWWCEPLEIFYAGIASLNG